MGLNRAFRIECNTLDDLEVALLSVLSSRMEVDILQSRVFQALTISSSASTTPLLAQDLTGRISRHVGNTINQVSPSLDIIDVGNEDATCKYTPYLLHLLLECTVILPLLHSIFDI